MGAEAGSRQAGHDRERVDIALYSMPRTIDDADRDEEEEAEIGQDA
jgi:hypothetical protein